MTRIHTGYILNAIVEAETRALRRLMASSFERALQEEENAYFDALLASRRRTETLYRQYSTLKRPTTSTTTVRLICLLLIRSIDEMPEKAGRRFSVRFKTTELLEFFLKTRFYRFRISSLTRR